MRTIRTTLVAVLAVLLTVTALWLTNRAVTPKEATWDDAVAEAREGGYRLVTTTELAEWYARADETGLLLVDTRQDWEFHAGHIEGALLFPMEPTAFARWRKKGELAEVLGPDKERPVVFY